MTVRITVWALRGLGLVVALVAVVGVVIWMLSSRQLARRYEVTTEPVAVPTDAATIARGQHLATAIGKCVDCHGDDLAGQVMRMGPVGAFPAANLTRGKGGIGAATDIDLVRGIRHGVAADGRPLVFMPSTAYAAFSASDLAALIAYVRSVPPVDNELPKLQLGPIGRMMLARHPAKLIAAAGIDHSAPIPSAVTPNVTADYGRYLTVTGGCTFCHGPNLKGGIQEGPPGTPPSADLTATGNLGQWSEADFRKALREGVRPDGRPINPFMPWRLTRLMTDEEISAVWAYLSTLK